jgi:cohesin complex subunit SA-1/2
MGTFIALQVTSALCRVAATITKELGIKQRQKEAEIKKAGTTAAGKRRVAEAENAVKEIHERKTRIEEYMQETETVLFVHRVRDSDPAIRTDCIKELGVWVKEFPEMYLKGQFFSHFTRSTNDSDGPVRLETMKALVHVFSKASAANDTSSFTLRIAPRLIQMAAQDTETAVRTNAIAVITQIDKTGALEDDDEVQRDQVARLIFDVDPKVRKAAAAFVKNIWEERAESLVTDFGARRDGKKKRAAKIKEEELQRRFEWKALAQLLVETSKELASPEDDDAGPSKALDLVAAETALTTRAAAASEALYAQIELLQDWHALVDYLLLDHSTSENDPWLLTEEEEDFMLEVLITCIRKEEEVSSPNLCSTDIQDEEDYPKSKALMKVLPRLFTKHQTEASRIVGILSITKYMNLSLYLDMRQTAAYETLWDDVTKQFLQHTDPNVLTAAIHAISTLTANTPMEATNKEKLAELEESLFTSLRDVIDGQDVSVMTIGEDQLASIEAVLLRVKLLSSSRDIVGVMQDEEGGQSSGWAIVLAFAERGGLGFKEEYQIVEYALYIAMVHIAWLVRRFTDADADVPEKVATLKARRDEALEVFAAFSVRGASNATDEVKRQAFLAYIHIHNLFSGRGEQPSPAARVAPLEMSFDKQNKLGGVFQVAAERYASDVDEGARDEDEDDDMTRAEKTRAVVFFRLVAAFVAAIRIGTIDVDQAKEPLAYVGRFGPTYDAIVKKLVDVLRDEGIYNNEATTVAAVVQDALQNVSRKNQLLRCAFN